MGSSSASLPWLPPWWVTCLLLILCVGLTLQDQPDEQCLDRGDYCKTLRADECYHNEEFCCRSCKQFASNKLPECKYGDRATVCTQEYCLFSWNLDLCCRTCQKNLTTTTAVILHTTTRDATTTTPLVDSNNTTTITSAATTQPCFDGLVNGISCSNYIKRKGEHLCYRYQDVCCKTCSKVRERNHADCPFGDKRKWCRNLSRDQCYTNNATCCATCETLKTNISECQFGDSIPSYCPSLFPGDCYEERDICCDTCGIFSLPGAPPGCQYGDQLETKICQRHRRSGNCSRKNIKQKCCATCRSKVEELREAENS